MADDAELLRCYANDGSEEAFTALVHQHLSLVYHAALRRTNGDRQLAEDVAQAVFANLAREAVTLQRHAVLAGWLYVATRHVAANAMRTEQRRKVREREAFVMSETTDPILNAPEWEHLRPELDSVMDELSDADRNAVLLRYFENQPYAEIGASFQISEDAARMRVDRALEKLRTLLARRGVTSTASALGGLLAAQSAVAAPAGLATAVSGSVLAGAAAAASSGGTAGLIAFMTTNKIVMGIAGVMALAAGGTAIYQSNELQAAETEMTAISHERDALRGQLQLQENRVKAAEEKERLAAVRIAELQKSLVADGAGKASAGTEGKSPTGAKFTAVIGFGEKMDILAASPEYAELQLKLVEAGLPLQYGPLYHKLGLSPEQIQKFEYLMMERQRMLTDTMAAARANGISVTGPALRQLKDPGQAEIDAKLRDLFGSEGYANYVAYSSTPSSMARSSVDTLATKLYATAEPLAPAQADRLGQIIANATQKPSGDGFYQKTNKPDWPTIYSQAKEVLSPAQLATLQAINRLNDISGQYGELMDKLMQEAAANAAKQDGAIASGK